jgi:hypothetical protein
VPWHLLGTLRARPHFCNTLSGERDIHALSLFAGQRERER